MSNFLEHQDGDMRGSLHQVIPPQEACPDQRIFQQIRPDDDPRGNIGRLTVLGLLEFNHMADGLRVQGESEVVNKAHAGMFIKLPEHFKVLLGNRQSEL